ncbi:MAG TPA: SprB repeat-containing protein, partial [Chitinophagaceae bacterium]
MRPAVTTIIIYLLSVLNTAQAQVTCNLSLTATPVGTSCSTSCDGSVVLTPSGGTAPYSFNAFEHSFPGSTVDTSVFDVINGNFSVSGGKLIAQSNPAVSNGYNNSIATKKLFADNGKLVVEGSFYIDYNTYTYFGLALNTVLSARTQVPYSFFFSYGTLYISNEGQTVSLGSYSNSTWYDFKIEKLGTTVNYYMRNTGLSTYTLVGSKTSTLTNSEYKLAAMYRNNYSSYGGFSSTNWRVGGNPATSGLCPGTYSYTVFDAMGCYASATVTLGTNPNGFQLNGTATATSCGAASDGSVTLSPAGGTAPYSYGFTQGFQGGTINNNLFELRNGNFSQGTDLREGSNYNNNDSWDNTISTRRTFSDGGSLVFEASFKFDPNSDVLFGFTNTGVIDAYADMMIGFRITNGTQVYAYTNKAGLVPVAPISSGIWYDFKIEKTGNDVYYYTRLNGSATWTLQYIGTYNSSAVEYKAAALNYSNFYSSSGGYNTKGWNVASVPKTSNLSPGTYTYTITDANGCTATAVLSVGTGNANSVTLAASVVNGACQGGNNGVVSLNASGGTAPYSYSFNHGFTGTYIEPGLFEARNGMFTENGDLRGEVIPTSTFWDNSLATLYSFNGTAALSFEGSFRFDANANLYFGFVKDTAVVNEPSLMQMGFYVNNGQLWLNAGNGDVAAGSVTANTWYDFKLQKKGGLIWFYSRTTGSGAYDKLQVIPFSGSGNSFRFATIMYGSGGTTGGFNSKNWVINDNPETSGLAAGNYNYRVFDANGCYAIAGVQLSSNSTISVNAVPANSSAWNTCDGAVSISSSDPNALIRRKAFTRSFNGASFNADHFEIRNGAFSQNNALVQNDQALNTGWDNSICTKTVFEDQGFLAVEMEMKFRSASQVYFGFSIAGQMLSSSAGMAYSYYYNAGTLYAYTAEAGLVQLGSISSNQWNGFRIEKESGSVRFYLRASGDIGWQLVHTASTANTGQQYCAGAVNYFNTQGANRGYSSRNWNVFTTARFNGLCPGQYTYKVLSGGCFSEVNFTIGTQYPLVQTMQPPANVSVNTDPGAAFASAVSLGTPTFAAAPAGITITNNAPLQFPAGVTNVTWTATDENGITVTGVQQVTVTDAEPPVIKAPADINITLFAGQTQATGVSTGIATATDNLPGVTISADNSSTTFPVG